MLADLPDRWIISTFCDDFRPEVDGKYSLMGIYNNFIHPTSFPAHFAKFAVLVHYVERIEEEFNPLVFRLEFQPDNSEHSVLAEASFKDHTARPIDNANVRQIIIPIVFSPLVVAEPGLLRVRVERAGVTYRGGAIQVRLSSPPGDSSGAK